MSRAPVFLAFLVTLLKLIYFLANRKVHRGYRLTALIGGYQFVCSGNVPDNSSVLKSRGGGNGKRESSRSGGRGLRQKHVSQSFLSVECDKHV